MNLIFSTKYLFVNHFNLKVIIRIQFKIMSII